MKSMVPTFIATFILLAPGCKKASDEGAVITRQDIIGIYKITSIKASANGGEEIEIQQPCEKDDVIDMRRDMIYTVVGGTDSCQYSHDIAGNWDLPNGTTLVIGDVAHTIKSCTGTQLVLFYTMDSGSNKVSKTIFYAKQ